MFVAYLWGIETVFQGRQIDTRASFVAYLWGIETLSPASLSASASAVCSLPMRDWNEKRER